MDGENGRRVPPRVNSVSPSSEPENPRLWAADFPDAQFVARPAEQPYAMMDQADFLVRPRFSLQGGLTGADGDYPVRR